MHGARELCLGGGGGKGGDGGGSGNLWDRNYLDRMNDTYTWLRLGLEISKNGSLRYHHWEGVCAKELGWHSAGFYRVRLGAFSIKIYSHKWVSIPPTDTLFWLLRSRILYAYAFSLPFLPITYPSKKTRSGPSARSWEFHHCMESVSFDDVHY